MASDSLTLFGFSGIAFLAATAATVMGFGVGTSLTPFFALVYPTHIAVMLVAIVHFLTNLLRLALFRRKVDFALVRRFGLFSIGGAVAGSFAQGFIQSDGLKILLGLLLLVIGGSALSPRASGWHFPRQFDRIGGFLSGALGGLLGNQGAVRSAYLANYDIPKESFVATAALIAVLIDSARIPIYVSTQWAHVSAAWPVLLAVTASAFAGTFLGQHLVGRVSQATFTRLVNTLIAIFGLALLAQGLSATAGAAAAVIVTSLAAFVAILAVSRARKAAASSAKVKGAGGDDK